MADQRQRFHHLLAGLLLLPSSSSASGVSASVASATWDSAFSWAQEGRNITTEEWTYNATEFDKGGVCQHVDCSVTDTTCIERVLIGKHLYLYGVQYSPYGVWDAEATGNDAYTGFDKELTDLLADRLGFTYTLLEFDTSIGGSWSEALFAQVDQANLVLSWWAHSAARRNRVLQVNGHIDTSLYVVTTPATVDDPDVSESLLTFLAPFHWSAWLGIVATVFLGAFITYLLERDVHAPGCTRTGCSPSLRTAAGRRAHFEHHLSGDGTVGALYTSSKAMLWGEHRDSSTALSAIANLFFGFLAMVVVAAYTANLATFMTLRATEETVVGGVTDLISNGYAACLSTNVYDLYGSALRARYPDLTLATGYSGHLAAADAMYDTSQCPHTVPENPVCHGAIILQSSIKSYQTRSDYCWLNQVGSQLLSSEGGFVTNFDNQCVALAFELGLHEIQETGELDLLLDKYLPKDPCTACTATTNTTSSDDKWWNADWIACGDYCGDALNILDMGGVLMLYIGVMLLFLMIHYLRPVIRDLCTRMCRKKGDDRDSKGSATSEKSHPVVRPSGGHGHVRSCWFAEKSSRAEKSLRAGAALNGGAGSSAEISEETSSATSPAAHLEQQASEHSGAYQPRPFFKTDDVYVKQQEESHALEVMRAELAQEVSLQVEAAITKSQKALAKTVRDALRAESRETTGGLLRRRRRTSARPTPDGSETGGMQVVPAAVELNQSVDLSGQHKFGVFCTGVVPERLSTGDPGKAAASSSAQNGAAH